MALAIVSISIVSLLHCHSRSLKSYVLSQIVSRATLLAEEKINEVEAKGLQEIDDQEAGEYENGFRYVVEEGSFWDEEGDYEQPEWRIDYSWRTIIEETEYDNVHKITVEVYSEEFMRESEPVDFWDAEVVRPAVRLVTYIGSTNQREDARSGTTSAR